MAIQYDLINNNTSSATKDGVQITTGVIVNELASASGPVQLDTAINMVGWNLGKRHDIYPQYTCTDIDARSIGPNEVAISYTFEYKFPQVQYEISSMVESTQTNMGEIVIDQSPKWVTDEAIEALINKIIFAEYTYPEDYKENPEITGPDVPIEERSFATSVVVDKYTPMTTVTITRHEFISGKDLMMRSIAFTGAVNSEPWTFIGWHELPPVSIGKRPRTPRRRSGDFDETDSETWLCTSISGITNDNGITYSVRYSFTYNENSWDKEVIYVDPRTGEPPADAEPFVFKIYKKTDFNILGLA